MTIQTAKTVRILKRRLEDLLLTLLVVLCLSACQFGQRDDLTPTKTLEQHTATPTPATVLTAGRSGPPMEPGCSTPASTTVKPTCGS